MFSTGLVVFREALEIAMILGIVLSATRGLVGRGLWIGIGFGAGLIGACSVAVFAEVISDAAAGMGQELFNAGVLFLAALVIGWTAVWMQTHARHMASKLKHIGSSVSSGNMPHYTLAVVIGLAILREASEIVLFVYGMLLSGQSTVSIASGTAAGLLIGSLVGVLMYFGLMKVPARYALKITSWMLILLVAGLASQGAMFLSAAGYFGSLSSTVWDSSWLISDYSMTGRILHVLVGYSAQPTQIALAFYGVTLAGLFALVLHARHKSTAPTSQPIASDAAAANA